MSIINWLLSLFGFGSQDATPTPVNLPAHATSVVHAMLEELKTHEQDHPILLHMTNWIDTLVQEKGEAVLTGIEKAVISALVVKYPALAPLLAIVNKTAPAQSANPPSQGQV